MASTLLRCDQPILAALTPSPVHNIPPPPIPSSDPHLVLNIASKLEVSRKPDAADGRSSCISISTVSSSSSTITTTSEDDDNDVNDNNDNNNNNRSSSSSSRETADKKARDDLFKLRPIEALQLLSASVELLVRITGDVPPTPPLASAPADTQMSNMQAEKESIARSHSEKNLAKLRMQALREDEEEQRRRPQQHQQQQDLHGRNGQSGGNNGTSSNSHDGNDHHDQRGTTGASNHHNRSAHDTMTTTTATTATTTATTTTTTSIDGVRLKHEPNQFQDAMPKHPPPAPEPYIIVGSDSQPVNVQHGAITRRFYSRNEPPISVNQYLLRLHQFCPMSTGVYLATSLYIYRLAVQERVIPVTRRNAHRLVLAGLRVAMKALEDLAYSHSKVAKVGGVSEVELARLEINFCFLAGFELVVGEKALREHLELLKCGGVQRGMDEMEKVEMEKLSAMLEKATHT